MRKKKWTAGELENNPYILREEHPCPDRLYDYFKDPSGSRPMHLEIGCGKGRFIVEMSRRYPDINFVAVERDPVILAQAARRAEQSEANALLFILADIEEDNFLKHFNPLQISRLYINFCDPWPNKKKWAKRRLTHEKFLNIYEELQISELFFKTDNRYLFEFSLESFCKKGWTIENISLDLHTDNLPDNIMTEYEEKFSAHGPIYRLEARPPANTNLQPT